MDVDTVCGRGPSPVSQPRLTRPEHGPAGQPHLWNPGCTELTGLILSPVASGETGSGWGSGADGKRQGRFGAQRGGEEDSREACLASRAGYIAQWLLGCGEMALESPG